MKVDDRRFEFNHDARRVALTRDGGCWLAFDHYAMVVKLDGQCNEQLRVPMPARVRAIELCADGSLAVLCCARQDTFGSPLRGSLVVVIDDAGREQWRSSRMPWMSSDIMAEGTTLLHVAERRFVYTVDRATTESRAMPFEQATLVRAAHDGSIWARDAWRLLRVDELRGDREPYTDVGIYLARANFFTLYATPTRDGAWISYRALRTKNSNLRGALVRALATPGSPGVQAIMAEVSFSAVPKMHRALRDGGVWALFEDKTLARVDASGAVVERLEAPANVSDPLYFCCSSDGTRVAALYRSNQGATLIRHAST